MKHFWRTILRFFSSGPMELKEVDHRLQSGFRNFDFLRQALTHKSYVNENPQESVQDNERLEFLGDAVLDLIISVRLMTEFPEYPEGELSKLRSAMVNERALAQLAKEFHLGDYLYLGRGEKQSGGGRKPSLLANAYEAVLGGLFLDRGFVHVAKVVNRHFSNVLEQAKKNNLLKDYKTQLQELVQKRFSGVNPRYVLVKQSGPDHKKIFEVALQIHKKTYGIGRGTSKKDAEQHAAKTALEELLSETSF